MPWASSFTSPWKTENVIKEKTIHLSSPHRQSPLPGALKLLLSQKGNLYIWPFKTDIPWCAQWRFVNQLYQDVLDKCIYTYILCIYGTIYIYVHTHTHTPIHISNRKYSLRCMSLWVSWMFVYIYITINQVKIQNIFIMPESYLISFAVNPHSSVSLETTIMFLSLEVTFAFPRSP